MDINKCEIVDNFNSEIDKQGISEGEYCVIVYSTIWPTNNKVSFVYKNVKEFYIKVDGDIKKKDSSCGIKVELFMFD